MVDMKRIIAVVGVLALVLALAAPMVADDRSSSLKVTILKEETGKPVRNASVVLHPVGKDGKQSRGGAQLKTNAEGVATVDGLPFGKMRVQVIAPGLQTYGDDYELNQEKQEIVIKLKPPQKQYSIYK